jgi:hypothetical protein
MAKPNPMVIGVVGLLLCLSSSAGAALMMGGDDDDKKPATGPSPSASTLPSGQFVEIRREKIPGGPGDYINLMQVEVFDDKDVNVALNKTVTMVPGEHGTYPGSKLTDGDYTSLGHTAGYDPHLSATIDLGSVLKIKKIVITNRGTCAGHGTVCEDRIKTAVVKILGADKTEVKKTPPITSSNPKLTYDFSKTTPAWDYGSSTETYTTRPSTRDLVPVPY